MLLVSRQRRQDAEKTFGEDWHSCARVWHIAVCLCQAKISNRGGRGMTVHGLKPDLAKGSGSFLSYGLHKTIVARAIGLPLFSRLRAKRKEFTSRFADRKAALRIGQAQNSRRRAGGNLDRAQEHARQIIWRVLHVVFRGEHFRDVLAASCCADARRCHWLTPRPCRWRRIKRASELVMRRAQELCRDQSCRDPATCTEIRRARAQNIPVNLIRITVTRPSLPFCLGARAIALGLASPLAGRDDAVEAAADCVQKRLVAERAADQLAPPQRRGFYKTTIRKTPAAKASACPFGSGFGRGAPCVVLRRQPFPQEDRFHYCLAMTLAVAAL